MKPWYAVNARKLLDMRKEGNLPDGPVVVSLMGAIAGTGFVLYVHDDMPAERFDWRMLVNLEVFLWADAKTPLDRLVLLADRIARARPSRLVLRFDRPFSFTWNDGKREITEEIGTHDVEIGGGQHHRALTDIPAQHDFVWCPLNSTGTPIATRLRDALVSQNGKFARL